MKTLLRKSSRCCSYAVFQQLLGFFLGLLVFYPFQVLSSATKEKVYRHSMEGSPSSLDPVKGGSIYSSILITSVYDTLYTYQYLHRPYRLLPKLAADFPLISADGLTVTIPLKKGVYFQDDPCFPLGKGREVTAHDAVYALKRHFEAQNLSTGSWLWKGKIQGLDEWGEKGAVPSQEVSGLKAKDRHTLVIHLKQAFPQLLYTLAMSFAALVPEEAVRYYGQDFAHHPVGSGPFRLAAYHPQKAVLVKNPSYRQEIFSLQEHGYTEALHGFSGVQKLEGKRLPLVDRVEVDFISQASTRWHSYLKGNEIHYTLVPFAFLPEVIKSWQPLQLDPRYQKEHQVLSTESLGFHYLEFNLSKPEIGYHAEAERTRRNQALRCAMRKAFDWEKLRSSRFFHLGQSFPGAIPPGLNAYDPTLPQDSVHVDYREARQLLESHGWKPETLPLLSYGGVAGPKTQQNFELFRSWLKRIGYPQEKLVLKAYATFADYLAAIKKGDLHIHGDLIWYLDYPDAENALQLFYGPNKSPGVNTSHYHNPEFDHLFAQAMTLAPSLERDRLFQQANRLLIDDCVIISGLSTSNVHMWHKNVTLFPSQGMLGSIFKYVDVE